jgi:hypothetical protein
MKSVPRLGSVRNVVRANPRMADGQIRSTIVELVLEMNIALCTAMLDRKMD